MITTLLLLQAPALAPVDLTSLLPGDPGEKTINIGGRFMEDYSIFSGGDMNAAALGTTFEDGAEVRRARIRVFGDLSRNIAYKMEYDWASGSASLADAYLKFTTLDGTVLVGHQFEPFGMEEQTSSRFITFLERSSISSAFAPSRNMGISYWHGNDNHTFGGGLFRDTDKQGKTMDSGWGATARYVFRPVFENDGENLLHFGVSASMRNSDGTADFSARPENHMAPTFVDTGALVADGVMLVAFEGAWQQGPLHGMVEWQQADVTNDTAGGLEPTLNGFTLQFGYFLTGEHRGYKTGHAVWSRVKPTTYALDGNDNGCGAWEVAGRYSTLDLTDAPAVSDKLNSATLGLNWYMNNNTRVMLDVTQAELDTLDTLTIIALRFAFDF